MQFLNFYAAAEPGVIMEADFFMREMGYARTLYRI